MVESARTRQRAGSAAEVFAAFLKLGLTSFGGPIAHLGYFRDEFVTRRRWIDDAVYANLVALCQFLPGPASSQAGFALGLLRAGPLGALAAWTAFTLPSAILLVLFAYTAASLGGPLASGALHGLKIVAVAIVAQAVWGMARALCPDWQRLLIAAGAILIAVLLAGSAGQIFAIAAGGIAGWWLCRTGTEASASPLNLPVSRAAGITALALFFLLLIALPFAVVWFPAQALAVFDSFYRAGALVFGGGHVVLPLLEAEVVGKGWVTADQFLAGYGAAQAIPGPLFAFAAYLGAILPSAPNGFAGASLALATVFLPGMLLLIGVVPFWNVFRSRPGAQAAMRGTNAAVVGILAAALHDPLWTGAITGFHAFALAFAGFILLVVWKCPPWLVVLFSVLGGIAMKLV